LLLEVYLEPAQQLAAKEGKDNFILAFLVLRALWKTLTLEDINQGWEKESIRMRTAGLRSFILSATIPPCIPGIE
jgi:hypothetical protein